MSVEREAVTTQPADLVVENARVVTPESVVEGRVVVEDDRIVAVEASPADARAADVEIDAGGAYLLPGLVDLHGDDIETHLYPRSGSPVETPMALASADRANVAAGITTKFHAIAFEEDPEKDRSPELAESLVDAIREGKDSLLADHRIHARCEVSETAAVDAVEEILDRDAADMVSIMCHIPGKGQFQSEERFLEYYENDSNRSLEEAHAIIDQRCGIADETITERIDHVVERAHDAGVVVASHDDESPVEVRRLADSGVDISEYPITLETAEAAREAGMFTTMGAPNLVRGGSQWGNLASADAIDADVVDALVADYHPPSLLAAPFVDTGEDLPTRVARVTKYPAEAVGLSERGRIERGARADLVVVDADPTPTVEHAVVAGESVYRTGEGCVE